MQDTNYWMKKRNFHLFYKVLLNKYLSSTVIQNKKILSCVSEERN